jgi:hypothetical protein
MGAGAPMRRLPFVLLVLGCRGENALVSDQHVEVVVDSPAYGEFVGYGDIEVRGHVTPRDATVRIEGELVDVQPDGTFAATVPWDRRWRVLDVEGAWGADLHRVRVPVFDGQDPMESWPGGLTLRVTPEGLTRVGEGLGGFVDATGWDAMLASSLPPVDTDYVDLVPTGVTHDPSVVELTPAIGGVGTAISLRNVVVHYDMTISAFSTTWTAPVSVGFGRVAIGALSVPDVDDEGMLSLTLTDAQIALDDPDIVVGSLDGWLLETVVSVIADWVVEPLSGLLLDLVLSTFGTIPLGGPYAFATDLMGFAIDVRLSDVWGDLDGLGAGMGMGLGEPAMAGPLGIPAPSGTPDLVPAPVHAAVGLHEGVLQAFLASGLTDMLTQEITLPGVMGELVGGGIRALPGGEYVPAEANGWCIAITPQPAMAARLQEGTAPLAVIYMPDLNVKISTYQNSACWPWLEASVAAEIGLRVTDGTKVGLDVGFVDGAVLAYASEGEWREEDVVAGLNGFLGGLLGVLGASFEMDLADLFGGVASEDPLFGALGDVQPSIVASQPMTNPEGPSVDGLYAVYLKLWE